MTERTRPTGLSRTLDVMARSRSKGTARLVLFALADGSGGEGAYVRVTESVLRFANCSPSDAETAIKTLVRLGDLVEEADGKVVIR